jgi:hypothetical protein
MEPSASERSLDTQQRQSALTAELIQVIASRMTQLEERMRQHEMGSDTRNLQQQIVDELTALLHDASSDTDLPGRSETEEAGTDSTALNAAEIGQSNAARRVPAGDDRSGTDAVIGDSADDASRRRQLLEGAWGQLPPRLRQQLQAVAQDQFLPAYEEQIERYFRKLAESDGASTESSR